MCKLIGAAFNKMISKQQSVGGAQRTKKKFAQQHYYYWKTNWNENWDMEFYAFIWSDENELAACCYEKSIDSLMTISKRNEKRVCGHNQNCNVFRGKFSFLNTFFFGELSTVPLIVIVKLHKMKSCSLYFFLFQIRMGHGISKWYFNLLVYCSICLFI